MDGDRDNTGVVPLRNILTANFCANREYSLVLFDRLPADQQVVLRDLTKVPSLSTSGNLSCRSTGGAISNDRPYRDLTEQCGHKTFQISGFWAYYGLSGNCSSVLRLHSRALTSIRWARTETELLERLTRRLKIKRMLSEFTGRHSRLFRIAGSLSLPGEMRS